MTIDFANGRKIIGNCLKKCKSFASSIDYLHGAWTMLLHKVLIIINEKSFPSRFPIDGFRVQQQQHNGYGIKIPSRFFFFIKQILLSGQSFFFLLLLLRNKWAMMHSLIYYSIRTSTMINRVALG